MLGGGELSVSELITYSIICKKDGDTIDLTEEAGKLEVSSAENILKEL